MTVVRATSVMGPMMSSLPSECHAAELMLLSVVNPGRHIMLSGSGEPIWRTRVVRQKTATGRVTASPDPPSRRQDFEAPGSVQPGCIPTLLLVFYAAIGPASVHR